MLNFLHMRNNGPIDDSCSRLRAEKVEGMLIKFAPDLGASRLLGNSVKARQQQQNSRLLENVAPIAESSLEPAPRAEKSLEDRKLQSR